jgi:hypothetical protein
VCCDVGWCGVLCYVMLCYDMLCYVMYFMYVILSYDMLGGDGHSELFQATTSFYRTITTVVQYQNSS